MFLDFKFILYKLLYKQSRKMVGYKLYTYISYTCRKYSPLKNKLRNLCYIIFSLSVILLFEIVIFCSF